ncbi:dicarboxylate/amino acid:cation symporter [Clostridium sp. JNZ J1-5]
MNSNYVILIISLLLLVFLHFLKTKKVSFGNRVLIALVLGVAVGAIFKENAQIIEPIGLIFVRLIKMLVIPLVITAIISSITSLDSPEQLKSIGSKTIGLLLLTTAIATVIGAIVGLIIDPGAGVQFVKDSSFTVREIPSFTKVLLDMVPMNPVSEMADGKIIPVIIFSIFISVAIIIEGSKKPESVKPVKDFIDSFSKIMFRITKMVIKLTPYGVFGLMVSVSAKYGLSTLIPLGKVILAVYIACALHMIITYGSLLAFVAKVNPIRFFKKVYPAQVVAFTTRSSYGTLPVTLKALTDRVKISDKIASFAAPMGATVGMNACGGLYPAIVAIFVARVFNIELTMLHYIILVATTTLSSIGIAGVPGTASIATTVVLTSLGLPVEGIAMVLGVDVIIDMARTAVNVTGSSVVALLVANSEGEFDRKAFNSDIDDDLELNM